MADVQAELGRRIARLAADNQSGAATILDEVIDILSRARQARLPVAPLGRALIEAQPSMASVWNAVVAALAADPARFERFAERVRRAPSALARFGLEAFSADSTDGPLAIVTISASRSVLTVLEALHRRRRLHVSCGEGRPALEGRQLATRLAGLGIAVTYYTDAASAHGLATADAVLVGADAIAPDWFLNKSGTRMLATDAASRGVPFYVAASRDKVVGDAIARRLVVREGAAAEVWTDPPSGVEVRNPYFERTPLEFVTSIITDAGVLGTCMIQAVCEAAEDAGTRTMLDELLTFDL